MARSIRAGAAHILLSIRNRTRQGFRDAERELNAFASRTAKIGIGLGVGGAALGGFFSKAVQEFARVEQLLGRFSSVFGDLDGQAGQFADRFATKINQSRLDIRDQLAQFQAVFQGFGFAPQNANLLTTDFVKATQDLVAFDDTITNSQEAVDKLLGGITGSNVRGVRTFGANILDSALAQELLRLGINKTTKEASQQEKILARYNIIMRALGRSGVTGQAAREVETLSAQFRGLRAASTDALAAIGGTIGPVVLTLTSNLTRLIRTVETFAAENPRAFQTVAVGVPVLFALSGAAITLSTALAGLSIGFGLLASFPVAAFAVPTLALAGMGAAAFYASQNLNQLRNIAIGLIVPFRDLAETGSASVAGIADALAGGQLELASRIGLVGVKLAWTQTFGELTIIYQEFINNLAKKLLAAQFALQLTFTVGQDREKNIASAAAKLDEIVGGSDLNDSASLNRVAALQAKQDRLIAQLTKLREEAAAARKKAEDERAAILAGSKNDVQQFGLEDQVAKIEKSRSRSEGTFFGANLAQQFGQNRDGFDKIEAVVKNGNKTAEQILAELKKAKPLVWSK